MAPAHNPFGPLRPVPASNPFAPAAFDQPPNQPAAFGAPTVPAPRSQASSRQASPSPRPAVNPFGPGPGAASIFGSSSGPAKSVNGALSQPSPFSTITSGTNPFGAPSQPSQKPDAPTPTVNPFAPRSDSPQTDAAMPSSTIFGLKSPAPANPFVKDLKPGQAQASPFGGGKPPTAPVNGRTTQVPNQFNPDRKSQDVRPNARQPRSSKLREGITHQPTEQTKKLSAFAARFAENLQSQLRKDGINTPQWPSEPGNPSKRGAMEKLKETYKKYRAKVYTSLRKAELIDDPEKRRRLEDALPFKGVCEDMCPDYERVTRICEYDVKHEEKEPGPDGLVMWPEPARMVKKFGRSAAGQDAPLPMDVRSVDALRRTTDYLLDDLLQSDQSLPALHNFLWDRTRAVRKDFTFHSTKSPEEMEVLVYCFETITRFHVTALHLLSRKGFAAEDFEQKQEIEQLGRSLLSLIEAYDDCRDKGVECKNEPEFRAYHLLLNTHDPFIVQRSLEWGRESWFNSTEIQLVFSLIHAMQSVEDHRGPIRPALGSTLADTSFTTFFSIVESPNVSYTMACFAEIHFTHVRQRILRCLVKAYSRRRDWPRDITASVLNRALRFDTDDEAVQFAELHGFEFSSENANQPYLLLKSKRKHVPSPRVPQSYSGQLVERKRKKQTLSFIIHNTIYEEPVRESEKKDPVDLDDPESLFVSQPVAIHDTDQTRENTEVHKQVAASPDLTTTTALSDATNVGANGFTGSRNTFWGNLNSGSVPNPHQATSPFSPASTSTTAPTSAQPAIAVSTDPLPSLKRPTPLPSQSQPLEAPVDKSVFSNGFTTSAFPPKPSESSAFSFVGKPSGDSDRETASSSIVPPPAKIGPTISFFPSLSSTNLKDNAPTVAISPSTPPGQEVDTGKAVDPSQNPRFPTPQQSMVSSIPSTLATPSSTFFPSTGFPKGATTTSSGGPTVGDNTSNTTTSAPSAGNPAFGLPLPKPASQVSAAEVPQPQNIPSQAQQVEANVPGVVATTSKTAQSSTMLSPGQPRTTREDPMGGLTKWFVLGDDGMMEQFMEVTLQDILQDTFEKWQEEEAERRRKEEDEESWKAARQHQVYNLRVKYFYRWQKTARTLAHRRILREGRVKMKAYRERERAAEMAKRDAELKAKEEARRKAKAEEDIAKLLHWDARKSSKLRTEEQLLASGIFSGMRDEREAVRRVMREASLADARREQPSRRSSIASSQMTAPASIKREGWKTRSLREKYGGDCRMRSNSASSSVIGAPDFSRSLPAAKVTNFSKKRYADDSSEDEPSPKRKANGVKSKHWELRARGLVLMPDGQWLPESIALPMQEGKRFKGIGNCGLGPGKEPVGEPPSDEEGQDPEVDDAKLRLERLAAQFGFSKPRTHSVSVAVNGTVTPVVKRKRLDDEGSAANSDDGDGSPSGLNKRAKGGEEDDTQRMVDDTQKMLRELKETMDQMDEDRPWFRQQIELMEKRQSMWD